MEPTRFEIEAETYRQKWQAALSEIERLKKENDTLRREASEASEWKRSFYRAQEKIQKEKSTQ